MAATPINRPTRSVGRASNLMHALNDMLYREHFGALLIFGVDQRRDVRFDLSADEPRHALNLIAEFIPSPDGFCLGNDTFAALFDSDAALEIPSSLPALIADQTGISVSCGGVKMPGNECGLHPQMSEIIFLTAQRVLVRARGVERVVWLAEEPAQDGVHLADIALNFFREIARINAALVQKMTLESRTDFLTGLYNRRGFEAVFVRMVQRSIRNGRPLALFYMDSDSLKAINDANGHDAGDRYIVDLSRVLNDMLRGSDLLSRWAGDEFVAAIENASRPRAYAIARRLNRAIAERTEGTISIGVYHGVPKSAEHAFRKADEALYRVKNRGKNDVELA